MKKVLFALSIVSMMAVTSCKKTEKTAETQTPDATATAYGTDASASTTTNDAATLAAGLPATGNAKVDDYLKKADDFFTQISAAATAKDQAKLLELQKQAKEFAAPPADLQSEISKLPVAQQQKVQEYFKAKSMELMTAMKSMGGTAAPVKK